MSSFESDFRCDCPFRIAGPRVNQQLAVDIEPRAVIGRKSECVGSRFRGLKLTGPAHGEIVLTQLRRGFVASPVEIDARIRADSRGWTTQLTVIEIFSLESRFSAVRGQCRSRNGRHRFTR